MPALVTHVFTLCKKAKAIISSNLKLVLFTCDWTIHLNILYFIDRWNPTTFWCLTQPFEIWTIIISLKLLISANAYMLFIQWIIRVTNWNQMAKSIYCKFKGQVKNQVKKLFLIGKKTKKNRTEKECPLVKRENHHQEWGEKIVKNYMCSQFYQKIDLSC